MSTPFPPRRLLAGGFVAALGITGLALSLPLEFGTPAHMGAGFLPRTIFVILIWLGAFTAFIPEDDEDQYVSVRWNVILPILGSTTAFAISIERLGLVISIVLTVALALAASRPFQLMRLAVLAIVLVGLCTLIFVFALSVRIDLWPTV